MSLTILRCKLASWVGGFLLGQIFALSFNHFIYLPHSLWLSVLQTMLLFFPMCLRPFYSHKFFTGAIFCLGFLWGFVHENTPPLLGRTQAAVVSADREYFPGQSRQLILRSQGGYVRAKGIAEIGGVGAIISVPSSGVVKAQKSYFSTSFSVAHLISVPMLSQVIVWFRERIFRNTDRVSAELAGWYRAFLLGDYKQLDKAQVNFFRAIGMIHVLVVSGLHIGLFAIIMVRLLVLPFWLLYIFGLFSANSWTLAKIFSSVFAVAASWVYAASVGFSPAAQRAFIAFAVVQLFPVFFGKVILGDRLLLVLTLQLLWFPNTVFSESFLISWSAYLALLIPLLFLRGGSLVQKIKRIFLSQFYLSVMVFAFVGYFSFLGFWANMILIPIFPLVFLSAFAVCFFNLPLEVEGLIHLFQLEFLQIITFFSNYSLGVESSSLSGFGASLRVAATVFFAFSVLIFLQKVPIKKV